MLATDPNTLPADVRHKLLLIRMALVYGDENEAIHWLYAIACPSFTCYEPWAALEGRTCQCGPHSLEQAHAPPSLESLEASYAGRPYSSVETSVRRCACDVPVPSLDEDFCANCAGQL